MSPGKSFLCSKFTQMGGTNSLPLKKAPGGHLHAHDPALELELLDLRSTQARL